MRLSQGITPHTLEWEEVRLKRLTASYIHKIFVSGKSKDEPIGVGGITYIDTKIAEMVTGKSESQAPETDDIMRGLAQEPDALLRYQQITNTKVHDSLFFQYNEICGGTTDGQICYGTTDEIKGIVEAKCPRAAKHTKVCKIKEAIDLKKIDPQYWHQPQMNMMICEAEYADFVSYNEDIVIYDAQIKIVRMHPHMGWRNEFKEKISWIADYVMESLETILKVGEINLQYRVEPEPQEVKKLQSAIESVMNSVNK